MKKDKWIMKYIKLFEGFDRYEFGNLDADMNLYSEMIFENATFFTGSDRNIIDKHLNRLSSFSTDIEFKTIETMSYYNIQVREVRYIVTYLGDCCFCVSEIEKNNVMCMVNFDGIEDMLVHLDKIITQQ